MKRTTLQRIILEELEIALEAKKKLTECPSCHGTEFKEDDTHQFSTCTNCGRKKLIFGAKESVNEATNVAREPVHTKLGLPILQGSDEYVFALASKIGIKAAAQYFSKQLKTLPKGSKKQSAMAKYVEILKRLKDKGYFKLAGIKEDSQVNTSAEARAKSGVNRIANPKEKEQAERHLQRKIANESDTADSEIDQLLKK